MQQSLWNADRGEGPMAAPFDAALEIGAYEALWTEHNASFKSIAEKFQGCPGARPSDFVPSEEARVFARRVLAKLRDKTGRFDVRIFGEVEYPLRLRDATHPVELIRTQGIPRFERITTLTRIQWFKQLRLQLMFPGSKYPEV